MTDGSSNSGNSQPSARTLPFGEDRAALGAGERAAGVEDELAADEALEAHAADEGVRAPGRAFD